MYRKGPTPRIGSGINSTPPDCSNLPLVMTKQQLAAILDCTTRHLDNLTRRGLLPAVHLAVLYVTDETRSCVRSPILRTAQYADPLHQDREVMTCGFASEAMPRASAHCA